MDHEEDAEEKSRDVEEIEAGPVDFCDQRR
jgi:hypothetical protein